MKPTVETCTSIFIGKLQKTIRKMIEHDHPDSTDEELYNFTAEELRKFTVNEQVFEYTAMKNRLGGHRWFFLCPKCKERVGKLFLPPPGSGLEPRYQCKRCHKIKNQSAVLGQNKMYQFVTRPLKRMKEIEDKVHRGHLTSEKVQELLNEYENLEKQIKDRPEYRVYSFKKTHGMLG